MRRAVLALLLAGCSYDWAASGTPSVDAGHDGLSPADASVADSSDGSLIDVVTDPITDSGPTDSGNGGDAPPDCAQLEQNVVNAFETAKTCTGGCTTSTCMTTTQDQCGCNVVVCNYGMDPNTVAYKNAVNAFKSSGCLAQYTCGDTCTPTTAACSIRADSGTYGCYY